MVQCRHYSLCTTVNFTMALHHLILNKADIFGQLYLFQVYQLYFVKYIIFGTEALLHEYKGKNTNVLILIIIILSRLSHSVVYIVRHVVSKLLKIHVYLAGCKENHILNLPFRYQ